MTLLTYRAVSPRAKENGKRTMYKAGIKSILLLWILFGYCGSANSQLSDEVVTQRLFEIMANRNPTLRFEEFEGLLSKVNTNQRFYLLSFVAETALAAGNLIAAANYSEELLKLSEKYPSDWNYGNAIHDGHIILGKIALAEGNIERAKDHLIRAGNTPGSPQLNTIGPDLSLIQALLEKRREKRSH